MLTAVIGAVGPLIWGCVEQSNEVKNPIAMAPYKPVTAPSPGCSPNAMAKGKATIQAVNPSKMSPLRFLKVM